MGGGPVRVRPFFLRRRRPLDSSLLHAPLRLCNIKPHLPLLLLLPASRSSSRVRKTGSLNPLILPGLFGPLPAQNPFSCAGFSENPCSGTGNAICCGNPDGGVGRRHTFDGRKCKKIIFLAQEGGHPPGNLRRDGPGRVRRPTDPEEVKSELKERKKIPGNPLLGTGASGAAACCNGAQQAATRPCGAHGRRSIDWCRVRARPFRKKGVAIVVSWVQQNLQPSSGPFAGDEK